jgi:hypothetical protein
VAGSGVAEIDGAARAELVGGVDDDLAGERPSRRERRVDHAPRNRKHHDVGRSGAGGLADGCANLVGERRKRSLVAGEADGDAVAGDREPAGDVPADVARPDDADARRCLLPGISTMSRARQRERPPHCPITQPSSPEACG